MIEYFILGGVIFNILLALGNYKVIRLLKVLKRSDS